MMLLKYLKARRRIKVCNKGNEFMKSWMMNGLEGMVREDE